MICRAKHTKYQPGESEWNCPKCGEGRPGEFVIYDSDDLADLDCELLHSGDVLKCETCGFDCSGRYLSGLLAKKANMIKCPCCRGSGFVKKPLDNTAE